MKNSLIETVECQWNILEEELSEKGKITKPMKIAGIASKGNVVNENNRYYKTSLFEREVTKLQDNVGNGRMVGELDHPQDGKSKLEKTAIKFTKLYMDSDYMKFEGEVIDNEPGRNLKALLRAGIGLDVSTRGYGSAKKEKINGKMVDMIQEDYELVAVDAVSGHSNKNAEIQYFKEKKNDPEGGNEMTLKELKEKHPELVAELEKETEARVKTEVTEKLTRNFEEKILDEISKTRDEMTEEITASVKEELMPEHEAAQAKLVEIADILGDIMPEDSEKTPDEKDESIKDLGEKLTVSNLKIDKLGNDLQEAKDEIAKSGVKEYLDEALKNEPFKVTLKERLSDCLTNAEVDERLPKEKDFVQKIVTESADPKGKGESMNQDEKDKQTKENLDEAKKKQRRLAGIPEPDPSDK